MTDFGSDQIYKYFKEGVHVQADQVRLRVRHRQLSAPAFCKYLSANQRRKRHQKNVHKQR